MPEFTTADPRVAGCACAVGSTTRYVVDFVATPLYKFGAGDTDWCTMPPGGAAYPVTSDPRVGVGLERPVGSAVMYVAAGVGLLLTKYGAEPKNWCSTLGVAPAASASSTDYLRADGTWAAVAVSTFSSGAAGTVPASGGGEVNYLRADGTWQPASGGGGSASVTAATLALGSTPKRAHRITVTDAAVSPSSKLLVTWGTALDTDANGPDMDAVIFAARPAAGSFIAIVTSDRPIAGPININYLVG